MHTALSDIHVTVEDTIIDGDKMCLRWICNCRHSGHGLGPDPADTLVRVTGITIMRVANGKLVEGWQNWDMLGMMEQIHSAKRAATYVAQ